MRKPFSLLVGLLAMLTLSLFGVGRAEAASNGNHDQGFTCTVNNSAGSTTLSGVFSYHTTGIGTSSANTIHGDRFAWHTTPAAQLDRIDIDLVNGSPGGGAGIVIIGGFASSENDVASSGSVDAGNGRIASMSFPNGDPGKLTMHVYGGVASANGSCSVSHNSL